jgi:hypothetical protein
MFSTSTSSTPRRRRVRRILAGLALAGALAGAPVAGLPDRSGDPGGVPGGPGTPAGPERPMVVAGEHITPECGACV